MTRKHVGASTGTYVWLRAWGLALLLNFIKVGWLLKGVAPSLACMAQASQLKVSFSVASI